jgi:hypothetical protein
MGMRTVSFRDCIWRSKNEINLIYDRSGAIVDNFCVRCIGTGHMEE